MVASLIRALLRGHPLVVIHFVCITKISLRRDTRSTIEAVYGDLLRSAIPVLDTGRESVEALLEYTAAFITSSHPRSIAMAKTRRGSFRSSFFMGHQSWTARLYLVYNDLAAGFSTCQEYAVNCAAAQLFSRTVEGQTCRSYSYRSKLIEVHGLR